MNTVVLKIQGSTPFMVPATDFMISPLSADASLYIDKLSDGANISENSKAVADITAGEYTKVTGAIPNIKYHINTTGSFEIVYNYE